jgi:hypothetical protein
MKSNVVMGDCSLPILFAVVLINTGYDRPRYSRIYISLNSYLPMSARLAMRIEAVHRVRNSLELGAYN